MSFQSEVKSWLSPTRTGGQLALAMVVVTVLGEISPPIGANVVLQPHAVLGSLKLWQVVTWLFVMPASPLSIIFGILIAIQTGSFLEERLGRRKLWAAILGGGVVTALLTIAVSLLSPTVSMLPFEGAWTVLTCMWVMQGLIVGNGRLNFWSLPVSGYAFAVIGAVFSLWPLLRGLWEVVIPTLIALSLTLAWFFGLTPANAWLRFRSWQLSRQLSRRSGHLKVVSGDKRNMPNDSDRFLH